MKYTVQSSFALCCGLHAQTNAAVSGLAGTAQAGESTGPSLLQKVKEYLPGQSGTTAERSSYEGARPGQDTLQVE